MALRFILSILITVICYPLAGQADSPEKFLRAGPEDFLTLIRFREKAVLIDVRHPFEYRKGRIENSINIPLSKRFVKRTAHIPRESVLLLYCTTDVRSIIAAEKMYDAGFRQIYILDGGTEAWERKGLPLAGKKR